MHYLGARYKKCGEENNFYLLGHTKKGFTYEIYIDEEDGANE